MLPKNCLLAAIDLGSNSFRLEIDRYKSGYLRRKIYLREPIRLGRGLDDNMLLSSQAMARGWEYLEKLGLHIKKYRVYKTRAIATQTLRQAKNSQEFIQKGQELLGHPIEIISGEQEALLIYTGVSTLLDVKLTRHNMPSTEKRLVIDIGGRSTEIITGQGLHAKTPTSTPIGSVSLSMQFFSDGCFSKTNFDHAIAYAKTHFSESIQTLKQNQTALPSWDKAYGASGTIGAIANVLRRNHITRGNVTPYGLEWLHAQLLKAGHVDHIHLAGLGERKDVIGGGLSSLMALFSLINSLHTLSPTRGALRQGILYDMIKPCQTLHQR
ncbi:MAG: hypothetical protein ACRCWR_08970 [Saezia sp.]